MGLKEMKNKIFPPCKKCPYKLGLVHTLVNPCPECKLNNYASYDRFVKTSKMESIGKADNRK